MILIEKLRCLEHLDYLIRHRVVGSPDEIAERVGVSRSTLYTYLKVFREYGAKINYDRYKRCFYYEEGEGGSLVFKMGQKSKKS